MPPFFWKLIQKRKLLCATVAFVGLAFSFALVFLERSKAEMSNQIEAVYDELIVTCSVTNLTGTQEDMLELPDWVINLFFTGATLPGDPRPENGFDTYIRDIRAKTTARCTVNDDRMSLSGITKAEAEASLQDVTWESGFDASFLQGDEMYCLVPATIRENTIRLQLYTKNGEEFTQELQVIGTHTGDEGTIYCPWAIGLELVERTQGYRKADRIGATFIDNRKIQQFWDTWGSRYFVEPSRHGTPVKWEASSVYSTYPYALTIYDDVLRATTEKLERNQQLFTAVSWMLLLAAFGVGFVLNFLSLRNQSRELKLQHILGVRPVGILTSAVLQQGVLCLAGIILAVVSFLLLFRSLPGIGILAAFWGTELAGTVLAYTMTMRKRFLETNLQGE